MFFVYNYNDININFIYIIIIAYLLRININNTKFVLISTNNVWTLKDQELNINAFKTNIMFFKVLQIMLGDDLYKENYMTEKLVMYYKQNMIQMSYLYINYFILLCFRIFISWYALIVISIMPKYYRVLRSRILEERTLLLSEKIDAYVLNFIGNNEFSLGVYLMRRLGKAINNESLVQKLFSRFIGFLPSRKVQKRDYTSTTLFDDKKTLGKAYITENFKGEKLSITGKIITDPELVSVLKKAFAHPSIFDCIEIDKDTIKVLTIQMTHSKVIDLKNGGGMETISLGRGKDGRITYVGVEGKSFIVKKDVFHELMKDETSVFKKNEVLITENQLELLRENKEYIRMNNISQSKIERLEENDFKERLMPLEEKWHRIRGTWID
jgi:hypothetical protein